MKSQKIVLHNLLVAQTELIYRYTNWKYHRRPSGGVGVSLLVRVALY